MPDPFLVSVVPSITAEELAADRRTPNTLLERFAADGHEGLMAKMRTAAYTPGRRSDACRKHPLIRTQEVIVCGWRLCDELRRMHDRVGNLQGTCVITAREAPTKSSFGPALLPSFMHLAHDSPAMCRRWVECHATESRRDRPG